MPRLSRIAAALVTTLLLAPFSAQPSASPPTAPSRPSPSSPTSTSPTSYFNFSPTAGTAVGYHQYDTQLEDYSAAAVQKEIAALHDYEKKIAAIDPSALDASVAADRDILLNAIRSQLLTLEVIRPWEKNPDNYSSGITNSIFVIMERPYAPANTRLRAAIEREKQIPQVFTEARKNLKNPAQDLHRNRPRTNRRPHQLLPERRPLRLRPTPPPTPPPKPTSPNPTPPSSQPSSPTAPG